MRRGGNVRGFGRMTNRTLNIEIGDIEMGIVVKERFYSILAFQ